MLYIINRGIILRGHLAASLYSLPMKLGPESFQGERLGKAWDEPSLANCEDIFLHSSEAVSYATG
jgi:hypothetical protein